MELMRLLFGTKDPAVREREAWIILLSRETKKENDIVVERLARSICCNFFFYGPTLQQLQLRFHSFNTSFKQLFGSFPTFLPETHREMLKCLHSQESLLTKQYHSNLLKWAQSLYGFLITKQDYCIKLCSISHEIHEDVRTFCFCGYILIWFIRT